LVRLFVFTVTFDQFNASLLNTKKKKIKLGCLTKHFGILPSHLNTMAKLNSTQ